MAISRVYVKPFAVTGEYVADWIDVTDYVQDLGKVAMDLDSQEYNIGVFTVPVFDVTMMNREGTFNDVDDVQSIFRFNRSNSLVKITYCPNEGQMLSFGAVAGQIILGEEVEIFEGLLNDDSLKQSAKKETVKFKVLGFDSLFGAAIVPFLSLNPTDTIKNLLYACLNQNSITDYLTVDLANINPSLNQSVDNIMDLENKTVSDALDLLLNGSNSVLYIKNRIVYVTARTPSGDLKKTFYGQASQLGAENLSAIEQISSGKNRIFNYLTWRSTTNGYQDPDSVNRYGAKTKEIEFSLFSNIFKQVSAMTAIVNEFKDPKQEMEITTPMDHSTLALNLLDRINIDYPTVHVPGDFPFPICGLAICGDPNSATLPRGIWSFTIPNNRDFKILKKEFDPKSFNITFKIREI